jgi:hypothetical protein
MLRNPLYAECIRRAAQALGGYAALGRRLGRSPRVLERWTRGEGDCGEMVFLQIVDILLDEGSRPAPPPRDSTGPAQNQQQGG